MAQSFRKLFGRGDAQNKIYRALCNFFKTIESAATKDEAIKKFKTWVENGKDEEDVVMNLPCTKLIMKEKTSIFRKLGMKNGKISTYVFLQSILKLLAPKIDGTKMKNEIKNLKKKLSISAAINTRRSLGLIDKIVDEINKKTIEPSEETSGSSVAIADRQSINEKATESKSKKILLSFHLFGFGDCWKTISAANDTEIDKNFLIKNLGYSDGYYSGLKIMTPKGEEKLKFGGEIALKKITCKELIGKNNVYFLMKLCFRIKNEESSEFFYANETFGKIFYEIRGKHHLSKGIKFLFGNREICEKHYKSTRIYDFLTKKTANIKFIVEECGNRKNEIKSDIEIGNTKEDLKPVNSTKDKENIKKSGTYIFDNQEIEIDLDTKISDAVKKDLKSIKSIGGKACYMIRTNENSKIARLIVKNDDVVTPEQDPYFREVFYEKTNYKVFELPKKHKKIKKNNAHI